MKYYGLNKELVNDSILHDIFSKSEQLKAYEIEGKYVKKGNETLYKTRVMGEMMEIPITTTSKEYPLEHLNNENSCHFLASFEQFGEMVYEIVMAVGETKEIAKQMAEKRLIERYRDICKIHSKEQLKEIIKQFESDFSIN